MIRPRRFALSFACLLLSASSALADWTTVGSAVPRLEMRKGDDKGSCSGVVFLIDDGWAYALTAGHCVDRQPTERLDITANDRHASAIAFNSILDLAVIKFRAHKETVIVLAPAMPPAGTEVAVVGYAFGVSDIVHQFGRVAQPYNKETKTAWFDVVTIFGDSGGAVVDAQGRLVAITSRIYSGGLMGQSAHISGAVPLDALKDFLDDWSEAHKKEKKP